MGHGITLRGAQLTRAILTRDQHVENRHFTMKPGCYALHTGANMLLHESQHALLASLRAMPGEASLPHCAIVGAVQISHALSFDECKGTEPWAFGPVCNVIQAVATLQQPEAHRGALSLWRIDAAALEDVRSQLSEACVHTNDLSHLAAARHREDHQGQGSYLACVRPAADGDPSCGDPRFGDPSRATDSDVGGKAARLPRGSSRCHPPR